MRSVDPQRLAIFLPSVNGGGAERVMVNLANQFANQGLTVDLILVHAYGSYLPLVSPAVNVIDLQTSGVLMAIPRLASYLRRYRPFALLSTLDHANLSALLATSLSRTETRCVIRLATTLSGAALQPQSQADRVKFRLLKHIYPTADSVIAVSQGSGMDAIEFAGISPDKVQVIYNPLAIDYVSERASQALDHPWFTPDQPPVILAVGRLGPEKDYPTLIHALVRVCASRPARLLLLGEGSQRDVLQTLIQDLGLSESVLMPGFTDNPYAYMRRAHLLALSSIYEGFPNVLVEALACGCPVVSTNCQSGPAEILQEGQYGRLVPVGDVDALAEAMLKTLEEPPNPEQLEERAADFALEAIAEQYLHVLQNNV